MLTSAILAACSARAMADGVWDFFGSVGIGTGRTDNPQLASQRLRSVCDPGSGSYNENDPLCVKGSSSYDPYTEGGSQKGEVISNLRLTGGLTATWPKTTFTATYSPMAQFYEDRTYLNAVSHDLTSTWRHAYSPRTTMDLNESFDYTPEQDLDPNTVQSGSLLTRQTSRTTNGFRGAVGFQHSAVTSYTWNFNSTIRAFSEPQFIDNMNYIAGFQWQRRVGHGSSFNSGYDFGIFTFGGGTSDPNTPSSSPTGSKHHQFHAGYGYTTARGFVLDLNAGYNSLWPDDRSQNRSGGIYLDTSVGWNGHRVAATTGYNRGFSDGGGAYATSENQNVFTNLRWGISQKISSDVTATYSVNDKISNTSASVTASDTIRTFNGRASVNYSVGKNVGLNASFTHYWQGVPTATSSVPEVRTNRYSLGMSWSFR